MKTITFRYRDGGYSCSEPGDQDGKYVPQADYAEVERQRDKAIRWWWNDMGFCPEDECKHRIVYMARETGLPVTEVRRIIETSHD